MAMLLHASSVASRPLAGLMVGRCSFTIYSKIFTRPSSSAANTGHLQHGPHVRDIRNIGIIAHVDAGKTTTTERMLYCSGSSIRQGTVDTGDTVTDFLPLERDKGITIQSAAVTFHWPLRSNCPPGTHPKTINLLDTPGHQDFRFEVDRCIPVLDGAVCIIDGVEGVEAHTERVWASAQEFGVPRIVFINKLDRDGASFRKSVIDLAVRLNTVPIVCQIPLYDAEARIVGVVDVLDGVRYRWTPARKLSRDTVTVADADVWEELEKARENIITHLADHDEEVAEKFLAETGPLTSRVLKAALRRVVSRGDGAVVPVFAGAALRSIGVEPLLDAVLDYLPSPDERPELQVRHDVAQIKLSDILKTTVGKQKSQILSSISSVFKVFNHPKEGLLSFVRVYDGVLPKASNTWNTRALQSERPLGMVQIMAQKTHSIEHLGTGQIGALKGLKHARTGDTIITCHAKGKPPVTLQRIEIRPPQIPPPLAFLAIDAYSPMGADELEKALTSLSKEDPSLRWTRDEKIDQFVVQGMGKLHLDIAIHDLKQRCGKVEAQYGDIQVDYKEHVERPTDWHSVTYDKDIAGRKGAVTVMAKVEPAEAHHHEELAQSSLSMTTTTTTERHGNLVQVRPVGNKGESSTRDELRGALQNGAYAALARGPRQASPLHGCLVTVEVDQSCPNMPSPGHYSRAARLAVAAALREAHERHGSVAVLEPVMAVVLVCPESVAGFVQHDITAAAGGVVDEVKDLSVWSSSSFSSSGEEAAAVSALGFAGNFVDASAIYAPPDPWETVTSQRPKATTRRVEIHAKVPYKEMLTYDEHLRSKTGGRHTLTMEFHSMAKVTGTRLKNLK